MSEYTLNLLSSKDDFIISKNPCCENCFQNKLNTKILDKFSITRKEVKEMKPYKIRIVNVKCECGKIKDDTDICEELIKEHKKIKK